VRVSTTEVATREIEMTVELDADRVSRAMRQAARRISKVRPVAGFRPGRAPYEMVERIYGRETILNEALNEEASAIYREAIKEANLQPYQQSLFDLESQDPVVLKTRVPLMPKVTLGDYASLKVTPEPEVSVDDSEIQAQLESLQRQHAEYEPVERPLQFGDQVVASISGSADGEQVVDQKDATLNVNEQMMPPGFAEAIAGASAGETRSFTLTYPADYGDSNLAGKTVSFDVSIKTVRQTNLPAIDDELAKQVGAFESLAQLRDRIAEMLTEQKKSAARNKETRAAVAALVSVAQVEYPAAALTNEINQAVESQRNRLARAGFAFDRYLQMINKTEEALREELRPEAERSLVERLALNEYATVEDIDLDPAELQAEYREFASGVYATYGERAEEMLRNAAESGALASVYAEGRLRKAARVLTDKLTGRADKAAEPPSEESKALGEFLDASQERPRKE